MKKGTIEQFISEVEGKLAEFGAHVESSTNISASNNLVITSIERGLLNSVGSKVNVQQALICDLGDGSSGLVFEDSNSGVISFVALSGSENFTQYDNTDDLIHDICATWGQDVVGCSNVTASADATYLDVYGIMGDPNATWKSSELHNYWEDNYLHDPVLQEYDSSEDWFNDTISHMCRVDAIDESVSITSSREDDPTFEGRFIHTLIGDVDTELSSKYSNLTFNTTDESLIIIIVDGEDVFEFSVPFNDLSFNFDIIEKDVNYVVSTVEKSIGSDQISSAYSIDDYESSSTLDDNNDDYDTEFKYRKSKSVPDSDGFMTDYTWYESADGRHVFMFGDNDVYSPEDGYFDHECESEDEAQEWFDSYNGFEDDDEGYYEDDDMYSSY